MKTTLAFIAASITVPCLFVLWGVVLAFINPDSYKSDTFAGMGSFFLGSTYIISIFVFLLGVPAYVILRSLNVVRWWSTILSAAILAATPYALLAWPLGNKSINYINGTVTAVSEPATTLAWLNYLQGVSGFAAAGAVTGLVFWLIIRTS
jgi:hypothetical protein